MTPTAWDAGGHGTTRHTCTSTHHGPVPPADPWRKARPGRHPRCAGAPCTPHGGARCSLCGPRYDAMRIERWQVCVPRLCAATTRVAAPQAARPIPPPRGPPLDATPACDVPLRHCATALRPPLARRSPAATCPLLPPPAAGAARDVCPRLRRPRSRRAAACCDRPPPPCSASAASAPWNARGGRAPAACSARLQPARRTHDALSTSVRHPPPPASARLHSARMTPAPAARAALPRHLQYLTPTSPSPIGRIQPSSPSARMSSEPVV